MERKFLQILGNERICYAKENSTVDPVNRTMTLFTQNVSCLSTTCISSMCTEPKKSWKN